MHAKCVFCGSTSCTCFDTNEEYEQAIWEQEAIQGTPEGSGAFIVSVLVGTIIWLLREIGERDGTDLEETCRWMRLHAPEIPSAVLMERIERIVKAKGG